jgi:hypothetical protein
VITLKQVWTSSLTGPGLAVALEKSSLHTELCSRSGAPESF